jgi:outer membrane protein assembly factor BamB
MPSDGTTGCVGGAPASCQKIWMASIGSFESTPAVSGGRLYLGADDGKVRAFKTAATLPQCTNGVPKTCNPLWSVTTGGQVDSSPAVADGVVYVGSRDDKLYALDAATGAVLWTATTGGDVSSSPVVANGVVYVGSEDSKIYAYDASGTTGCSGTPKVCTPSGRTSPAIPWCRRRSWSTGRST